MELMRDSKMGHNKFQYLDRLTEIFLQNFNSADDDCSIVELYWRTLRLELAQNEIDKIKSPYV